MNNKSVHHSYQTRTSEKCSYCFGIYDAKDCYDQMVWGEQSEQVYEGQAVGGQVYKILFGNVVWHGQENYYCDNCINGAEFNFGSISLKKNKYTILNKQYTETDFFELRDKLIKHMQATGEWGEYFPQSGALFMYNESHAQEFFPLSKEQAVEQDWQWQENLPGTFDKETLKTIPDDISEIEDSILKEVLKCKKCERNYKLAEAELEFYKQRGIPVPDTCPNCRHYNRTNDWPKYNLFQRQCQCDKADHEHNEECRATFLTAYSPDDPEIIYCEECYKKEIY